MKIIYHIHKDIEHCGVNYNDKYYKYSSLIGLLKKVSDEVLDKIKNSFEPIKISSENIEKQFTGSTLSKDELNELIIWKKKAKAKSWLSSQRALRRKGKLNQYQIDSLNKLGMLWNPTTDEWEKSFKRYKKQFLVATLEEITNEEDFFVSRHSIERLYNEQKWENHQRDLYINNDLSSENYLRLKSINFPFTEPYDESNFEIKVIRLIKLIVIIKELHSNLIYDGIKAFVKRFKLSKKNDLIGSIINIEEERAEQIFESEDEENKIKEEKVNKESQARFEASSEYANNILKNKTNKYFISKINSRFENLDPVYIDDNPNEEEYQHRLDLHNMHLKNKGEAHLEHSICVNYLNRYDYIKNYLDDLYIFPKTVIDNVEHSQSLYIQHKFDEEIKEHASKLMVKLIDERLLNSKTFVYFKNRRSFKEIVFLINHYKKKNNIEELGKLLDIVNKHQTLSLLYAERISKILKKSKTNFNK